MESIDDLLAQVKAEYQEKDQGIKPKKKHLFNEEEFKSPPPAAPTYQSQPLQQSWVSPAQDSLISHFKADF